LTRFNSSTVREARSRSHSDFDAMAGLAPAIVVLWLVHRGPRPDFPKLAPRAPVMAAEEIEATFQEGTFVRSYLKRILITTAMLIVVVAAVTSASAQDRFRNGGSQVRGGGNVARGGGRGRGRGRGRGNGGGGAAAAGIALGVIGVIGAAAAASEERRYYEQRRYYYDGPPRQRHYYYD
jgi:hypothetical protein